MNSEKSKTKTKLFHFDNFNGETPLQSDKTIILLGFIYKTIFSQRKKGSLILY